MRDSHTSSKCVGPKARGKRQATAALRWTLLLTMPVLVGVGCGGSGDDDEEAPAAVVNYAVLSVDSVNDAQDQTLNLTTVPTCSANSVSGLMTGSWQSDSGRLDVSIKGFSTQDATFTCSQASDNTSGDIGNRFDGCSVALNISSAIGSATQDTFAMHRASVDDRDFSYQGTCTIQSTYAEPRLNLTIECGGLVQTFLEGARRNPIDPAVTASLTSGTTAFCDLVVTN